MFPKIKCFRDRNGSKSLLLIRKSMLKNPSADKVVNGVLAVSSAKFEHSFEIQEVSSFILGKRYVPVFDNTTLCSSKTKRIDAWKVLKLKFDEIFPPKKKVAKKKALKNKITKPFPPLSKWIQRKAFDEDEDRYYVLDEDESEGEREHFYYPTWTLRIAGSKYFIRYRGQSAGGNYYAFINDEFINDFKSEKAAYELLKRKYKSI